MAAMAADAPLVDSISISLGGRRDDLIGCCYAKPLSMIGDVAYSKPTKDELDYEMLVRELIHECFTPMVRDFPGAGYPEPGDMLAPLQDDDDYSIKVWAEGLEGTLKLLGRGLLFLPDDHGYPPFFIPRGKIESLRYRHMHEGPWDQAALDVSIKNWPDREHCTFCGIHKNELPAISNVIRGKGWNIGDLDEIDLLAGWFRSYGCRCVGSESGHGKKRKKRKRLVKKYLRGAPAPAPPSPPAPPKKRRRLVKKYL